MASSSAGKGFIGKRRARTTRASVKLIDRLAGLFITLGGLGTILAVSLVCLCLVVVVIPLFIPESMSPPESLGIKAARDGVHPVKFVSNEYRNFGWIAYSDGTLRTIRLDDGRELAVQNLVPEGTSLTAIAFTTSGGLGLGFANGTIQLGTISFETTFLADDAVNDELKSLGIGEIAEFESGIVEVTPEKQFRLQKIAVTLQDPVTVESGVPIRLMDLSTPNAASSGAGLGGGKETLAMLTDDGVLRIATVRKTRNLLTGRTTTKLSEGRVPLSLKDGEALPTTLRLAGLGDSVYVAWEDGQLQRYDTRQTTTPVFAESLDLVDGDARLTSFDFMVGKSSLVIGDSDGNVSVWFRIKPDDAETPDGAVLVRAHDFPATISGSAVTSLATSRQARTIAAGFDDGRVEFFNVTSRQLLATAAEPSGKPVRTLALAPRDDSLFGLTDHSASVWSIHALHPEVDLSAIVLPVWYEGYNEPDTVWQSSSGDDAFEPKYGFWPLIFGTIKATFYSMLFGAPLALLAAIYTSEFLHPRTRARVKPTIEIMASLPSVVLGFLAALFFAPMVENLIPETIAVFVTVPFLFLLGAYLWQLMPHTTALKFRHYKLLGVLVALLGGVGLAIPVGRLGEDWFCGGDIKGWLDGRHGSGVGAWMFILLPASAVLVAVLMNRFVTPGFRQISSLSRFQFTILNLVRFLTGCLTALALALLLSFVLNGIGWDPRGTFVGQYVQRNALVVGFIMGFAIIPIIYTISDDALTSVPESLRAASLGAGATQWQTAVRVIIPTAMSGLFSAVMIGLGRAVGETMIVLMAAGNTPVKDWNIFSGFRTLSANIAVELPEAVQGSTHYRLLFLAALTLFGMTFVLNTVAEVIRLRFRKRAFQL